MNPIPSEDLKSKVFSVVGLLFAAFVGLRLGCSDYSLIVVGTFLLTGLFIWFGTGQWFWLITIACSYLGGTFPILRGSFTPFQILMAIGVAKFLIEEVILRRKRFQSVEPLLLWPLTAFMAVLTIHGIRDRFGMHFLGSSIWGGRNYVNVYVGLLAFFVIQSVTVRETIWNKLPYLVLAVTGFDLVIATVTTLSPASILFIFPFYSAVGVSGLTELLTGHEALTNRIGPFGNVGCTLAAAILAATSICRLFDLRYLFRLLGIAFGTLAVIYSGYRSAVANLFFTLLSAGFRDLRLKVLLTLPLVLGFFLGLSSFNSFVMPLPRQMQRALTFLPGDWEIDMVRDARSSNEFRSAVWSLWWREYFPKQAAFGRGFGFRSDWAEPLAGKGGLVDYQQMVETGNIHNGLFASLDAIGVVGTIFFAWWNLRLLHLAWQVRFDRSNPTGFALRFLAIQLAIAILAFCFGAVTLGTLLPQQFAVAGLFLRLHNQTKQATRPPSWLTIAEQEIRRISAVATS